MARGNALITINNEAPQEIDLNIRSKADSLFGSMSLNLKEYSEESLRKIL